MERCGIVRSAMGKSLTSAALPHFRIRGQLTIARNTVRNSTSRRRSIGSMTQTAWSITRACTTCFSSTCPQDEPARIKIGGMPSAQIWCVGNRFERPSRLIRHGAAAGQDQRLWTGTTRRALRTAPKKQSSRFSPMEANPKSVLPARSASHTATMRE